VHFCIVIISTALVQQKNGDTIFNDYLKNTMKSYIILAAMLLATTAQAKTYTIGTGKGSDPSIWGNQYIGTTIKPGDVVIITGKITMNAAIVVEGRLQIEGGAALIGMKDLTIAKSGSFVNNGITVVEKIVNKGVVTNNQLMKTMMDNGNDKMVLNTNTIVAANSRTGIMPDAPGSSSLFANAVLYCDSTELHTSLSARSFNAPDIKGSDFCTY
jgi:hypothetical protein